MIYPKKQTETLDSGLFKDPTKEYRGAPFWAWNCELKKETLEKQIDVMKEMGFGGYYMHTRVGMATKYLSEEFMELVRACIEKGKEQDMYSYLYDEDRWPSGSAGGFTTKDNDENRQKILYFTYSPYNDGTLLLDSDKAKSRTPEGEHTVELVLYGNRINTFGQLHKTDEHMEWIGPDSWRTSGIGWTDEYQLTRFGILAAPRILTEE